uniref:J domain-containing protein n=1 Tax=Triticum monococcum TaxID=4568 RepID=Q6RUK5_TRIMO|nr:unknown [Triticum monococcum]
MEAVKKKQLEAQLEAADKLLAAGDLRRANMHVDMAVAMDRSGACPEAQRARAAYRVLAADKANHYAVLGVAAPPGGRPTKESHDAVKSQHKALCDMFDPGKAGGTSAAVAGAFKLVNQAFAALTDIRKNEGAVPGRAPAPRHRLPPLLPVPRPKAKPAAAPARVVVVQAAADEDPLAAIFLDEPVVKEHKAQGAEAVEDEEEDYNAGGVGRGGRR